MECLPRQHVGDYTENTAAKTNPQEGNIVIFTTEIQLSGLYAQQIYEQTE